MRIHRHFRCATYLAVAACCLKLLVAAHSYGTTDVLTYWHFAQAINRVGPVRIYGIAHPGGEYLYNHPPLTGLLLEAVYHVARLGIPFPLALRSLPCLADLVSALAVYLLARQQSGSPRRALCASALVSTSPVLAAVSGFHGNTDPIFVMLVLVAGVLLYVVPTRHARLTTAPYLASGVCCAGALGIKLVPVVLLPTLAAYALSQSRRGALAFGAGFTATSAALWTPALLTQWSGVMNDVVGYRGLATHFWGISRICELSGMAPLTEQQLMAVGGVVAVLGDAGFGLWLLRRAGGRLPAVLGLVLGLFLAISPSGALQYLAWPAATLLLADLGTAAVYEALAGAFLISVYTGWCGGFPWGSAIGRPFTMSQGALGLAAWSSLVVAVVVGTIRVQERGPRPPLAPSPQQGARLTALTDAS